MILTLRDVERLVRVLEVPVHGEVDNACAVPLGIVGSMVGHAVEECVGALLGNALLLILAVVLHGFLDVCAVM